MIEVALVIIALAVFETGVVVVALVWDMTKVYHRVQDLEDQQCDYPNRWGR